MREDILDFLPIDYIKDHQWEVIYDEKVPSEQPDRYRTGFRCTECNMEIDADFVGRMFDDCDFWVPVANGDVFTARSSRGVYNSIKFCSCAEMMLKEALE